MSYSYSYKTRSRGGSRMPHTELLDEAEFQNAKMQAMMGAPAPSHDAGSHSYSYKSTNSSSTPRTSTSVGPGSTFPIDPEMEKMKREMDNALKPNLDSGCGSSTYSYSSKSSNSGGTSPRPTLLHVEPVANTGSGSTVKKVVTTTTTKTNPQAVQELEHIQRQFNRIGRTPADYEDDFESLKRDITTGKAYKDGETAQDPLKIRVREERFGNVQPYYGVPLQSGSSNNSNMTTTTTTTRKFGSGQPITEETTTKTSAIGDRYPRKQEHDELLIPVNIYDDTFDDFHMNRWFDHQDHLGSLTTPELDIHRLDWQNRLRSKKTDMFKFLPHSDFGGSIESNRTVAKNPLGKPEFSVQFDMRDFKADDISLTTKNGKLIISATHEDKVGNSTSHREFTRSVDLPADIQINMMKSVFSRDGILSITAPIKPPHYNPLPIRQYSPPPLTSSDHHLAAQGQSNSFMASPFDAMSSNALTSYNCDPAPTSQSHRSASNSASLTNDACSSLDFALPVSGYLPEDITVTVDGRKVKVYGKHVETRVGGRKTHNEFTKMFDLPSSVRPESVRCYIKDGHTLHIRANIEDNLTGAVHFLPITRKW